MTFTFVLALGVVLPWFWCQPILADELTVVADTLFWHSPNFTAVAAGKDSSQHRNPPRVDANAFLGELAYDHHFESKGAPPPIGFLHRLEATPRDIAYIDRQRVVFPGAGVRISLKRALVPPESRPAAPYLLSGTGLDWVLVVYPYYLVLGKETKYVTELYSAQGVRRAAFDSLPTHVSASDSQVLVSPDRAGCCDSLRWSFRFYNLRRGSVLEFGCPESRCGDVLFTKFEPAGPFLVVQEIVGRVAGVGSFTETSVHIVDDEGGLSASGKLIHAVRDPAGGRVSPGIECALPSAISAQSPYAVKNLISVEPLPQENAWLVRFGERATEPWKLVPGWDGPSPSIVFGPSQDATAHAQ